jgi:hypothetical protein
LEKKLLLAIRKSRLYKKCSLMCFLFYNNIHKQIEMLKKKIQYWKLDQYGGLHQY